MPAMKTIPSTSLLPTGVPPSFADVHSSAWGDLLRRAMADEEGRQFSDSMQQLALVAEATLAALRLDRRCEHAAPVLMDMLTAVRDHRAMVAASMGPTWRGQYVYEAYLQALDNFRVQIGQWLLDVHPWDDELQVTADGFALVAWRTLADGMLLADMLEQWLEQ